MLNVLSRPSIRRVIGRSALLLGAALSSAGAQSLSFGELEGVVLDAGGQPVGGAEVRVRDRSSGATRWTLTTREGTFRFSVLPAGRYDVTAEALGYRPVVHTDVVIAAGHSVRVAATLRRADPPVTAVDTVVSRAATSAPGAWLVDRGYADLFGSRRTAGDGAFASSRADAQGVEGLPWRYTEMLIDGSRSAGVGTPGALGDDAAGLAMPIRGAAALSVGGMGFDAEVGGSGVGIVTTTRRAGGRAISRSLVEGGTAGYGGSFIAAGPLQGDTALGIFGVDYHRSQISRPGLFGADAAFAGALIAAAQGTYGADLSALGAPADRTEERMGAFGRLDWQPGDRFALSVRASGSRFTSTGIAEPTGSLAAYGSDYEAISAQASVNLYSRLTRRITQEFRFSADVGKTSGGFPSVPRTSFAGSGFSIGGSLDQPFADQRTTPRVSGLLHFALGAHQVKAGVSVASHRFDAQNAYAAPGTHRFGDVADFAAGAGAWRGIEGAVPAGEYRMTETSFLLQDSWRVADGFSVTFGTRIDGAKLPVGEIESNADWLAATGIDNRDQRTGGNRFSPRFGLRWELGSSREWVLEGGAGVFHDLPDRRDLAEALSLDRGADVRYGVGTGLAWPGAPSAIAAPLAGRTLTLLGPDFEGPRTRRLALGLSRQLGTWTASVSGVYRHTDYLARRRNLNLPATALGEDQYGRPLFGTLQQVGTLLAAVPQSNQRFAGFDEAHALESTGFSEYRAATIGLERAREEGLSVSMSYSYSRTLDNVGSFGTTSVSPFPYAVTDWVEGTSDLDVPHRVFVGAEWSAGRDRAFQLGGLYRLSSGQAFTPGLRDGVDANGDGDGMNDPAMIDANLAGMTALLGQHDCLATQVGRFAGRNTCRADLAHRLDLRASIRIATLAIGRLDLVLDALDVIATETGRVDNALLLVDRSGTIGTDPLSGRTLVPYVVNPGFGTLLADRSPGVLWRIGMRVTP